MMYTLVGTVLALGWVGVYQKTKDQNSNYYLIFAGLVLLLFMGLRGDFTTDYGNYARGFAEYSGRSIGTIIQQKEPLFYLIIKFLSNIGLQHFQILHFILSALVVLPAVVAVKRTSKNYLLSIFFFFALTYYIESFNILRNCIAISIVLIGYPYLLEKKIIPWAICVLIASGFHFTAILLLPVIILMFIPANRTRAILLAILVILVILFYEKVLDFFQQKLGFYSGYTETSYGMWSLSFAEISKKRLLVRVSVYIAYLGMVIKKKELLDERVYLLILSIGLYLLQFKVFMLYRFDLYFLAFFIFLFPNTFEEYAFPKKAKAALMLAIVVLCLIWNFSAYGGTYYPFWKNVTVGK